MFSAGNVCYTCALQAAMSVRKTSSRPALQARSPAHAFAEDNAGRRVSTILGKGIVVGWIPGLLGCEDEVLVRGYGFKYDAPHAARFFEDVNWTWAAQVNDAVEDTHYSPADVSDLTLLETLAVMTRYLPHKCTRCQSPSFNMATTVECSNVACVCYKA